MTAPSTTELPVAVGATKHGNPCYVTAGGVQESGGRVFSMNQVRPSRTHAYTSKPAHPGASFSASSGSFGVRVVEGGTM